MAFSTLPRRVISARRSGFKCSHLRIVAVYHHQHTLLWHGARQRFAAVAAHAQVLSQSVLFTSRLRASTGRCRHTPRSMEGKCARRRRASNIRLLRFARLLSSGVACGSGRSPESPGRARELHPRAIVEYLLTGRTAMRRLRTTVLKQRVVLWSTEATLSDAHARALVVGLGPSPHVHPPATQPRQGDECFLAPRSPNGIFALLCSRLSCECKCRLVHVAVLRRTGIETRRGGGRARRHRRAHDQKTMLHMLIRLRGAKAAGAVLYCTQDGIHCEAGDCMRGRPAVRASKCYVWRADSNLLQQRRFVRIQDDPGEETDGLDEALAAKSCQCQCQSDGVNKPRLANTTITTHLRSRCAPR